MPSKWHAWVQHHQNREPAALGEIDPRMGLDAAINLARALAEAGGHDVTPADAIVITIGPEPPDHEKRMDRVATGFFGQISENIRRAFFGARE